MLSSLLLSLIASSSSKQTTISPVLQWAQNSTHVVFDIKFAKKASNPARTSFKAAKVDLRCDDKVGSDSGGCSLDFVAASPDENFDFVIEQEFHSRINVAESTTREKAAGRFFVSLKKVTGVEEEEKGDEDKNKHKNNDEEKEKNGEDEDEDFDEDEQGYISKSTAFRWKSIFKNKYKGSAILWYDMQKQFYLEEHDKEFNVLLGDDDETEELRELFEEFEAEVKTGEKRKELLQKNNLERKKQEEKMRKKLEEKVEEKVEERGEAEPEAVKEKGFFAAAKNLMNL